MDTTKTTHSANANGKGSGPRNNYGKKFWDHFDEIDWDNETTYEEDLRAKRMKKHQQVSVKSTIIDEK